MPFKKLKRFAFFLILLLNSAVILSAQVSVNGSGATSSTLIKITPVYSESTTEKTGVKGVTGLGANQSINRKASAASTQASVTFTSLGAIINADSEPSITRFNGFLNVLTKAADAKGSILIYVSTIN